MLSFIIVKAKKVFKMRKRHKMGICLTDWSSRRVFIGSCVDEILKREVTVYGKEGHHKKFHGLPIKRHEFESCPL